MRFERAGRLFVHRVIRAAAGAGGKERGALITKGDALDAEDEPVTRAEFLGRVIRVHRGNRHIEMGAIGRYDGTLDCALFARQLRAVRPRSLREAPCLRLDRR